MEDVTDLAMRESAPAGILVLPGNAFNYMRTYPDKYLRLSYSYASFEEMDEVSVYTR